MLCAIRCTVVACDCTATARQKLLEVWRRPVDGVFIGRVRRQLPLRGPGVHDGRTLKPKIVGKLGRAPGCLLKRVVKAVDENKGILAGRRRHLARKFGVKVLLRFRYDAEQHDMLVGILAKLQSPDRGPLDTSHAMVARDADVQRAQMQRLIQLPISAIELAGGGVARGLAVGGVENPHHRVILVRWRGFRSELIRKISAGGRRRWRRPLRNRRRRCSCSGRARLIAGGGRRWRRRRRFRLRRGIRFRIPSRSRNRRGCRVATRFAAAAKVKKEKGQQRWQNNPQALGYFHRSLHSAGRFSFIVPRFHAKRRGHGARRDPPQSRIILYSLLSVLPRQFRARSRGCTILTERSLRR